MYVLVALEYHRKQRRRGVKRVGRAGSCNLPADSCKFPKEDIVGAKNFQLQRTVVLLLVEPSVTRPVVHFV